PSFSRDWSSYVCSSDLIATMASVPDSICQFTSASSALKSTLPCCVNGVTSATILPLNILPPNLVCYTWYFHRLLMTRFPLILLRVDASFIIVSQLNDYDLIVRSDNEYFKSRR